MLKSIKYLSLLVVTLGFLFAFPHSAFASVPTQAGWAYSSYTRQPLPYIPIEQINSNNATRWTSADNQGRYVFWVNQSYANGSGGTANNNQFGCADDPQNMRGYPPGLDTNNWTLNNCWISYGADNVAGGNNQVQDSLNLFCNVYNPVGGRVVDAETQAGIGGVPVRIINNIDNPVVYTDGNGNFSSYGNFSSWGKVSGGYAVRIDSVPGGYDPTTVKTIGENGNMGWTWMNDRPDYLGGPSDTPYGSGSYEFQRLGAADCSGTSGATGNTMRCNFSIHKNIPPVNNAQCISSSSNPAMTLSTSQTVSFTVKNTGNTTWTNTGNYHLGSQQSQDNTTWGFNRVYLYSSNNQNVAPGQTTTFTFNITAPSQPGNYPLSWEMVQDGVQWFGDLCQGGIIQVNPPAAPPPTCTVQGADSCNAPGAATPANSCSATTSQTCYHNYYWSDNSGLCNQVPYTNSSPADTCTNTTHYCSAGNCLRQDCNATPYYISTFTAPANTCYTNNASRSVKYTTYAGSTDCNPVYFSEYETLNNCSLGYTCSNQTCNLNAPSHASITTKPSCKTGAFTGSDVTISWVNPGVPISYVDISTDPNFGSYYHKAVSGNSTTADNFNGAQGQGALTFQPNTNYYVRLYNGANDSPSYPYFIVPSCLGVSCSATPNAPQPNETVNWTATPTGGVGGTYTYTFSGAATAGPTTNPTVSTSYSSAGNQTVNVSASNGTDTGVIGTKTNQTANASCSVSVNYLPYVNTTGGDVHSNTNINAPGGPP